jgi:ABC-type oligopeptide transport system substrate-binding subunit
MFQLNTARPLFSHARLRRAVAYAIDRRALAAEQRRFFSFAELGGGVAVEGYVPTTVAGGPGRWVYPLNGPGLRRARALAGHRRRTGVLYTCSDPPCPQQAAILRSNLRAIGIDVQVHEFPKPRMYALASRRGARYDIVSSGWTADVGDPSEFLNELLDGDLIGPRNNSNLSYFDDPTYNRKLHDVAGLSGAARYRAYARLTLDLEAHSSPLGATRAATSSPFAWAARPTSRCTAWTSARSASDASRDVSRAGGSTF